MGGVWYHDENEHVTAESIILACLVFGAIIFELAHHKIHHVVQHVQYGIKSVYETKSLLAEKAAQELKTAAAIRGANYHYGRLFERASGEFMVLGFLAFCVWSVNQAKGFKHISESLDGRPDETNLLHLCENVHMFLFLSMVLNFIIATTLIHKMMKWQLQFAAWEHDLDSLCIGMRPPDLFDCEHGTPKQCWHLLKQYFLEGCRCSNKEGSEPWLPQDVTLDDSFDFSRYISAAMDHLIEDVVQFANSTWLIVLTVFGLHGLISYVTTPSYVGDLPSVELQLLTIVLVLPALGFSFLLFCKRGSQQMFIKAHTTSKITRKIGESFEVEVYVARVMQGIGFITCYLCSRLFASVRFWEGNYEIKGNNVAWVAAAYLATCLGVLAFCGFWLLPRMLINTCVYYAMPPHVDEVNKKVLLACTKYKKWSREDMPPDFLDDVDWAHQKDAHELLSGKVHPSPEGSQSEDTTSAPPRTKVILPPLQVPESTTEAQGQ